MLNEDSIPEGWLECDGSSRSTKTYKDLHDVIGDRYGKGEDSFKLPIINMVLPLLTDTF